MRKNWVRAEKVLLDLASRIAREWVKPTFNRTKSLPQAKNKNKTKNENEYETAEETSRAQKTSSPFEDDITTTLFRGRDVSAKTIQFHLKLHEISHRTDCEGNSTRSVGLLSGFPPRSLSLKVMSEKHRFHFSQDERDDYDRIKGIVLRSSKNRKKNAYRKTPRQRHHGKRVRQQNNNNRPRRCDASQKLSQNMWTHISKQFAQTNVFGLHLENNGRSRRMKM